MTLTRTRIVLIAALGALVLLGAACVGGLGSADDDGEASPEASGAPPGVPDDASQGSSSFYEGDVEGRELRAGYEDGDAYAVRASGSDGAVPSDSKLQDLLDRKIIQSTSVDIETEDVGRSFQDIIRVAETAGGFVASSTFSNVDDAQVADITIRVPGDRYQDVLAQIRSMGEVVQESSDANDVTEEYTDLEARLRTLEATERRYLELLGQADEINEILLVQDRLDSVRGQIEQVQGRINMLEHLTDLATIAVHLRPPAEAVKAAVTGGGGVQPLDAAAGAWDTSLTALRGLAAVALVVAVFSWWLLPPLAALGIGARWWLSRRARPAPESPV